jgi:hypothetical protein
MHSGKRHRQERSIVHIVNPNDPHILGNAQATPEERVHQESGNPVVGANKTVAIHRRQRPAKHRLAAGILIAADPRIHSRCLPLICQESDPPRAQLHQVLRRQVSRPMIIDPHQIASLCRLQRPTIQ